MREFVRRAEEDTRRASAQITLKKGTMIRVFGKVKTRLSLFKLINPKKHIAKAELNNL